ncbi:Integrase, catalytic core [Gossypium australe]|uniref:Integrase, catalytic core n=1 Tax=Gossypium australe TaxID=47621 RepID=A0A5B6W248_9ROSI|nr:Integrase, catalytic core [Gossypium australe]
MTQLKGHSEEKAKKYEAKSCIESFVSYEIFIRILIRSDKTKQMQVLNRKRGFEVLKMQEFETVKEYKDISMKIVNKLKLLKKETKEFFAERFESKISSLEDSKNLTKISLVELTNVLEP